VAITRGKGGAANGQLGGAPADRAGMGKRTALWRGYVAVGALAAVGYYLLPRFGVPALAQVLVYVTISGSAAAALLTGVRRYRPARPAPWLFLAAGQILYALADLTFYLTRMVLEIETYPYWDDVLYLSSYPLMALGLVLFVRRRTPGWDGPSAIDSTIIAVVAALLLWVYLVSPRAFAPEDGPLAQWVSIAYPAMDLLLLTVGVRLLLGRGARTPTHRLIYGSLLLMLVADVLYGYQELTDTFVAGNELDAIWLGSALLLGASALHPSMARLGEPADAPTPDTSLGRLVALAAASMVAPLVLLEEALRAVTPHALAVALAGLALFPLTLARMSSLVVVQRRMAVTDGLTGLRTRRYFSEQLARHVATARRGGTRLGLMMLDVDHFKAVNDTYGHDGGDAVLREIARRLTEAVRPSDVVARYGGEEFAVLLPGLELTDVERLAERIIGVVSAVPVEVGGGSRARVTLSVGAVAFPDNAPTGSDLVTAADRALYAAKDAGRNRVVVAPRLAWASS